MVTGLSVGIATKIHRLDTGTKEVYIVTVRVAILLQEESSK